MNNFLQFEWKKWAIVEKWVKMKKIATGNQL